MSYWFKLFLQCRTIKCFSIILKFLILRFYYCIEFIHFLFSLLDVFTLCFSLKFNKFLKFINLLIFYYSFFSYYWIFSIKSSKQLWDPYIYFKMLWLHSVHFSSENEQSVLWRVPYSIDLIFVSHPKLQLASNFLHGIIWLGPR